MSSEQQAADQVDRKVLQWYQHWHPIMAHADIQMLTKIGEPAAETMDPSPPDNLPEIEGPGVEAYKKAFECSECKVLAECGRTR